ncbi:hypothetical protein ACJOV8_008040 [Formosa sp. 3Alg 14/1]|uniref:hypothetical protein n=1 Tax=Formosa sp. 3Alg 14/1 TaxID=3382190 RepID=UPI0039BE3AC2
MKQKKYQLLHFYYRNFKKKPKGVAMFHFGRCGSTVVSELLNQHPSIKWDNELFQIIKMGKPKLFDVNYEKDMFKVLVNRYSRTREEFYGFETKAIKEAHLGSSYLNLEFQTYLDELIDLGFNKFIILKRRNYLKQVFSIARGIENKQFHFKNKENLKGKKINFDPQKVVYGNMQEDILKVFNRIEERYELLEKTLKEKGVEYLEIYYEDHIEEDPNLAYQLICDYIDALPHNKVEIKQKKISGHSILDEMIEPELVMNHLRNTQYEWMLK